MDKLSVERRSWNMSRIKSRDTTPERQVRSLLHAMGFRFRLQAKTLPGRPDIVLPKYKTAVFVHGCFWHRHPGCRYAYTPKTRVQFWNQKFAANIRRDQTVHAQITELGWRVLIIWECELRDREALRKRLRREIVPNQRRTARPKREAQ